MHGMFRAARASDVEGREESAANPSASACSAGRFRTLTQGLAGLSFRMINLATFLVWNRGRESRSREIRKEATERLRKAELKTWDSLMVPQEGRPRKAAFLRVGWS